ncbi:DUF5958 family protein [Streptomyces sp. NPDC096176]|uniref:DUF5958 family protein n=1 Tax=Streptomyces sp. NPDC096176 TaxID=3366079 RepID=UPI003830B6C7
MRTLESFCRQARAGAADAAESIARSGIRPTRTPAVMLTQETHKTGVPLPEYELTKASGLPVALLGIADTRRRERFCTGGCGHEWHQLVQQT